MLNESLSRRSFLGLEGRHVFITGASGAIGGEAVREFLGGCPFFLARLGHLILSHPEDLLGLRDGKTGGTTLGTVPTFRVFSLIVRSSILLLWNAFEFEYL